MQMYLLFLNNTYISMYSLSAPTRGATRQGGLRRGRHTISTRAPARGATRVLTRYKYYDIFQPAPPRGERQDADTRETAR